MNKTLSEKISENIKKISDCENLLSIGINYEDHHSSCICSNHSDCSAFYFNFEDIYNIDTLVKLDIFLGDWICRRTKPIIFVGGEISSVKLQEILNKITNTDTFQLVMKFVD